MRRLQIRGFRSVCDRTRTLTLLLGLCKGYRTNPNKTLTRLLGFATPDWHLSDLSKPANTGFQGNPGGLINHSRNHDTAVMVRGAL